MKLQLFLLNVATARSIRDKQTEQNYVPPIRFRSAKGKQPGGGEKAGETIGNMSIAAGQRDLQTGIIISSGAKLDNCDSAAAEHRDN